MSFLPDLIICEEDELFRTVRCLVLVNHLVHGERLNFIELLVAVMHVLYNVLSGPRSDTLPPEITVHA